MKFAVVLGVFLAIALVSVNADITPDEWLEQLVANMKNFAPYVNDCVIQGRDALNVQFPTANTSLVLLDNVIDTLETQGKACKALNTTLQRVPCFAKHAIDGIDTLNNLWPQLPSNETFIKTAFFNMTLTCMTQAVSLNLTSTA